MHGSLYRKARSWLTNCQTQALRAAVKCNHLEKHQEALSGGKTRQSAPYLKSLAASLVSGVVAELTNTGRLCGPTSQQAAQSALSASEEDKATIRTLGWDKVVAIRHGAVIAADAPPTDKPEGDNETLEKESEQTQTLTPYNLERNRIRFAQKNDPEFGNVITALEIQNGNPQIDAQTLFDELKKAFRSRAPTPDPSIGAAKTADRAISQMGH